MAVFGIAHHRRTKLCFCSARRRSVLRLRRLLLVRRFVVLGRSSIHLRGRRNAELEPADRALEIARHEMRVDLARHLGIGVRQDPLDGEKIDSRREQQTRSRVPQIMEAHAARDRQPVDLRPRGLARAHGRAHLCA